MPFPTLQRRTLAVVLAVLLVCCTAAWWIAGREIEKTRFRLVGRQLTTAADILRAPATEVLSTGSGEEKFRQRLRDVGAMTGLRLTLIRDDGSVVADSEVLEPMPNLGDRPEVREAAVRGRGTDFRRSIVTGEETLYVARALEKDGARIGMIRAATGTSEVQALLDGVEATLAVVATICLALGAFAGWVAHALARRREEAAARGNAALHDRLAA